MRLLSLYIENYGKFSRFEYQFSPYIAQFCEENGYGKTTLASFIKAMFYGLPSYTVRSKEYDDRRRYYPFNGGKFGGSLRFEWRGKEYRIERFFDKKSSAKDERRVFCGNLPTAEFLGEIGNAVFGLDEQAFSRTAFFNAEDRSFCEAGNAIERLSGFIGDESSDGECSRAIALLDKASKELKATRGANDLINKQKQRIFDLNATIATLQTVEQGLGALYEERERLTDGIRTLSKLHREELAIESQIEFLQAKTSRQNLAIDEKKEKPTLPKRRYIGVALIAFLFLLTGGIQLAFSNLWGLLPLGLGVICGLATALLFRRKKAPSSSEGKETETEEELRGLESRLSRLRGDGGARIEEKLLEANRALARIDGRIEADEREVARLYDLQALLATAQEKLREYETRYRLLVKAKTALENAEKRLQSKYVHPMKQGFLGYAETVEKTLGEKMYMDENFAITFERGGELRSGEHLSAGQRALANLCFRLALLDNVYEDEPPFLLLDDPFVSLDETHFERVAKVLRALSEEKQIVYFCCHESRKLK